MLPNTPAQGAPFKRRAPGARAVFVLKAAIWAVGVLPPLWLLYGFLADALGVNPIEKAILVQGRWALGLLLATLAVTPLRIWTGWNPAIKLRRLLGLFAFYHVLLHFLLYAGLDQFFAVSYILEDVVQRRYITAGFVAFLLLIPLAVTSTKGWIRRLGGKRWRRLHRAVYPAAGLGVLHYFWKVRADTFWPIVTAGVLILLLLARRRRRPGGRMRARTPRPNKPAAKAAQDAGRARKAARRVYISGGTPRAATFRERGRSGMPALDKEAD